MRFAAGACTRSTRRTAVSFFETTPGSREMGDALVNWALERFSPLSLEPDKLAVTLLAFRQPLKPENAMERPAGFAYHGDQPFYPCSVVKVFYLAAVHARLEK